MLLCLDGLLLGLDGESKCRGFVEVTYRKLSHNKIKKNGAWLKLNRGLSSFLPLVAFARVSPLYSLLRMLRTLPIQGYVKGLQTLTSLDLTTEAQFLFSSFSEAIVQLANNFLWSHHSTWLPSLAFPPKSSSMFRSCATHSMTFTHSSTSRLYF